MTTAKLTVEQFRDLCRGLRDVITSVGSAPADHERSCEAERLIPLVTELRHAELKRPKGADDLYATRERVDAQGKLAQRFRG